MAFDKSACLSYKYIICICRNVIFDFSQSEKGVSMPAGAIANTLGQLVGQQFLWQPGQQALLNQCLTIGPIQPPSYAFSCYELPFYGARMAYTLLESIERVLDGCGAVMAGRPPNPRSFVGGMRSYNNYGIWKYIWAQNTPVAGDFVFFSANGVTYDAHVAIATGNGYDTISFGHDGVGNVQAAQALLVQRMTVDQIFAVNPGLRSAHFLTPNW